MFLVFECDFELQNSFLEMCPSSTFEQWQGKSLSSQRSQPETVKDLKSPFKSLLSRQASGSCLWPEENRRLVVTANLELPLAIGRRHMVPAKLGVSGTPTRSPRVELIARRCGFVMVAPKWQRKDSSPPILHGEGVCPDMGQLALHRSHLTLDLTACAQQSRNYGLCVMC